jgi:DNA-binding response OmpR family regulator
MAKAPLIVVLSDIEGDVHRHVDALSAAGFETSLIGAPAELLPALLARRAAAVVIDRKDADWKWLRELRGDARVAHTPFIALHADQLTPLEKKQTGCDLVLPKPCSGDELLFAIEAIRAPESRRTQRPPTID